MTPTFQTSLFTFALDELDRKLSARRARKARAEKWHIYQVVIQNYDLEEETLEIEALDPAAAADEATRIYDGDIYNMCIYDVTAFNSYGW